MHTQLLKHPVNLQRLAVLGLLALLSAGPAGGAEFRIGVVREGPAEEDQELLAAVKQELGGHLPEGTEARWIERETFDAAWDPAKVGAALDAALGDHEVDAVLLLGLRTTAEAARDGRTLSKPAISGWIQRPDYARVGGVEDDRSTRTNLAVTVGSKALGNEVEAYAELADFKTLDFVMDPADQEQLGSPAWGPEIALRVQPFTDTATLLDNLPDDTEAVLLYRLPQVDREARRDLYGALAERGIPAFSTEGVPEAELGALAATGPDLSDRLALRLALSLARLTRGETTADLPVRMQEEHRLVINARTAAGLDIVPSRSIRWKADLVDEEGLALIDDALELGQAMELALASNSTLAVQMAVTRSTQENPRIAGSYLLPQIGLDASYIDSDSTFGISPAGLGEAGSTRARIGASQMIYDDARVSRWRSARHVAEGSLSELEAVRLDVLAEANARFVGLALKQAMHLVELDNLRLTEQQRELARHRVEAGIASRSEVLFWDSQVARSRGQVLKAEADVKVANVELDRTLGVDQGRRWRPSGIDDAPERFPFLDGALDPLIEDPASAEPLRQALVATAIAQSPELAALGSLVDSQEVQTRFTQRRWWLPSFFATFNYSTELSEGSVDDFPGLEDDGYTFYVAASYPLFEGGRRLGDSAKARADLEVRMRDLERVAEWVEADTRNAVERAVASFGRIDLGFQSRDAARENLQQVQDRYAEGVATIEAVSIAQSQQFTAEQMATASVYEHLLDLVALQRALSWFEAEKPAQENHDLAAVILAATEGAPQP